YESAFFFFFLYQFYCSITPHLSRQNLFLEASSKKGDHLTKIAIDLLCNKSAAIAILWQHRYTRPPTALHVIC
ncbi:MAG: hypothetical protein LUC50_05840, partial [Ruminococcus sp.]|nr:hypothetical protein [Ruminococcus sp.]